MLKCHFLMKITDLKPKLWPKLPRSKCQNFYHKKILYFKVRQINQEENLKINIGEIWRVMMQNFSGIEKNHSVENIFINKTGQIQFEIWPAPSYANQYSTNCLTRFIVLLAINIFIFIWEFYEKLNGNQSNFFKHLTRNDLLYLTCSVLFMCILFSMVVRKSLHILYTYSLCNYWKLE